ncbi:MAG: chromosome segregation protein SMC, partial [Caulobacterales bacterium]|nr:chromosome segregation protein SMC [Caulobacterales bacterium]
GDDADAGLSDAAPRWWAGADITAPPLPEGATPLAAFLQEAPDALTLRLGQIGVVAPEDAPRLAIKLHPGQQLVSKDGGAWRWDGYRVAPGAPLPAAARLERRARIDALAETEAELAADVKAANTAWSKAKGALNRARDAAKAAGDKARATDSDERQARNALDAAERACAARAQHDAERRAARERLVREREETSARIASLEADLNALPELSATEKAQGAARGAVEQARGRAAKAAEKAHAAKAALEAAERRAAERAEECERWRARVEAAESHLGELTARRADADGQLAAAKDKPASIKARREGLAGELGAAETRAGKARDAFAEADTTARAADQRARRAETDLDAAKAAKEAGEEQLAACEAQVTETDAELRAFLGERAPDDAGLEPAPSGPSREECARKLERLKGERDALGAVNLAADDEAAEREAALASLRAEREDLEKAVATLRGSIAKLDADARKRLREAFDIINARFGELFQTLFGGGEARLALVDSDDPLDAGLDIHVSPPGKKLGSMSLLSGGEQALTATALIFAVFLANPAPVCALDEVDAPLDDANTDRYCRLLAEMTRLTDTRFLVITHNPVTMSRVDRLFGVTMAEAGVSQLVSVDLTQAEHLVAAE